MYARFRTWLVGQIASGATPAQVGSYCALYRKRHLATCQKSWADGSDEVPSEAEIAAYEAMAEWQQI